MVMDGFNRLIRGSMIHKKILGRKLVNNVSYKGLGSYPLTRFIYTFDSLSLFES